METCYRASNEKGPNNINNNSRTMRHGHCKSLLSALRSRLFKVGKRCAAVVTINEGSILQVGTEI